MAQYTPNLGLIKPAGSDNVAIQQLNTNMDTLDTVVHENSEKIDQLRVGTPPYIDSATRHWMVYDVSTQRYVDSGVSADGHGATINATNGHWMLWDSVNDEYVDSGISAHPLTFTAAATTLPAGSDATASIGGTQENPVLNLGIPVGATGAIGPIGPQGSKGDAAGFGVPTASVDSGTGAPTVTVTATGPDTAKQFNFEFHNLKGEPGGIAYIRDTILYVTGGEDSPTYIQGTTLYVMGGD